jgi:hypothetical protein
MFNDPTFAGEGLISLPAVFEIRGARAVGSLQIGNITVQQPPVIFRNPPGVVIGVPLLEQLVIVVDQRNRRVRVAPVDRSPIVLAAQPWESAAGGGNSSTASQRAVREGEAPTPPAPGQPTMGFNLAGVPGGALGVRNIVAGSSAGKAGLKEGDQLIEFDGTRGPTPPPLPRRFVSGSPIG